MSAFPRPYAVRPALLSRLRRARGEQGQIGILVLGLFCIVLVLILGAVDVTAAQLARMRLLDAADAAALDAADALDERSAYESGMLERLILTDGSVQEAARTHLARAPRPPGITAWSVVPQTGTIEGATAVVTVQGTAILPMSGWILESLGGSVTITVTSRARAPLS
jgi:Flp pilus assembly protein TadG